MPTALVLISRVLGARHCDAEIRYAGIISGLKSSELSRGAHLEKLRAVGEELRVYSVRLNGKSRLLLTRMMMGGVGYWLLLDELEHHDYKRSAFLNRRYLKRFLIEEAIRLSLPGSGFDSRELESSRDGEDLTPVESDYFNHRLIELNDNQSMALESMLPMIVMGMPGSGKSCVAASLIRKSTEEESGFRVLYVTSSERLVSNMYRMHASLPMSVERSQVMVEYKTYTNLIKGLAGDGLAGNLVIEDGFSSFEDWCAGYLKKCKLLKKEPEASLNADSRCYSDLYQGLRMMSGYDGDGYPVSSSSSSSRDNKTLLSSILQAYRADLEARKVVDLALWRLGTVVEPVYDQIVVDEAQDFSTLQLKTLFSLAKGEQIAYFIDSNQSLYDDYSKLPFLKGLLHDSGDIRVIELPYTFRCSEAAIALANGALGLKHYLTGGILDKHMASRVIAGDGSVRGSVVWSTGLSLAEKEKFSQSVDVAIVCDAADVQTAREGCPGVLVLTVDQAKGLEYEVIIVYGLIERSITKEMNDKLANYTPSIEKVGRPKKGQSHQEYGPRLNRLFTAFTRARSDVYVLFRGNHHALENVFKALQGYTSSRHQQESVCSLSESTQEQRLAEIRRQLAVGNDEVAWHYYRSHILDNEQAFKSFRQAYRIPSIQTVQQSQLTRDEEKKAEPLVSRIPPSHRPNQQQSRQQGSSRSSSSSSSSQDETVYITQALDMLLNVEDPGKFFLTHPIENKAKQQPLSSWIKEKPRLQKTLFSFLNNSKFRQLILSNSEKMHKFLFLVVKLYKDYANTINAKDFYKLDPSNQNPSILGALLQSEIGYKAVIGLIEQNPTLIDAISADELCQARPVSAGIYENTSVLYWFSIFPVGRALLQMLLNNNTKLAAGITAEALCRSLPTTSGDHGNVSVLYSLSVNSEGRALLQMLLNNNPRLAEGITAEALCRALPNAAGADENVSALYALSGTPEGHVVLQTLLNSNPKLAEGITAEALCRALPDGTSAYSHLKQTKDGCEILLKLYAAQSKLKEILASTDNRTPGTVVNSSGIGLFSSSSSIISNTTESKAISWSIQ
ncbi:MAG: hypothetical protein ACOVQX_05540 [Legionella sp.]